MPFDPPTEEEGIWSGPLGLAVRLIGVAALVGTLFMAVMAAGRQDDRAVASQGTAESPKSLVVAPRVAAPPTPVLAPTIAEPAVAAVDRPMQGPSLPRRPTAAPQALCDAIKVGERAAKWTRSQVFPDEWECTSFNAPSRKVGGKTSKEAASVRPPSLFSIARGTGKKDIRNVRMKVTAADDAGLDQGLTRLGAHVEALFSALAWPLPERVSLAMRLHEPFLIKDEGTTIQLLREYTNERSYNLIVTFPKLPMKKIAGDKGTKSAAPAAPGKPADR